MSALSCPQRDRTSRDVPGALLSPSYVTALGNAPPCSLTPCTNSGDRQPVTKVARMIVSLLLLPRLPLPSSLCRYEARNQRSICNKNEPSARRARGGGGDGDHQFQCGEAIHTMLAAKLARFDRRRTFNLHKHDPSHGFRSGVLKGRFHMMAARAPGFVELDHDWEFVRDQLRVEGKHVVLAGFLQLYADVLRDLILRHVAHVAV